MTETPLTGHRQSKGMYLVYLVQIGLLYFTATGFLIDDIFRAFWGVIAIGITFIPRIIELGTSLKFHWSIKFSITLPLFLHIGGGVEKWYFIYYPLYDKIGHIVAAMIIAYLLFLLFIYIAQYTTLCRNSSIIVVLVILLTMFFGSVWEIAEQYLDLIYTTTYYHDVIDSIIDQVFNLLGVSATAYLINREMKKYSFDEIFKKFFRGEN